MTLGQIWTKFYRYMKTCKCRRAGHEWCTLDGPLPDDCPKCVDEILAKYGQGAVDFYREKKP